MSAHWFGLALLGFAIAASADESIGIKGSDTLGAKLVPQLIEVYLEETGSQVVFSVEAEGSSTAFTELLSGGCQLGMSSREPKPEEVARFQAKGRELKKFVVAVDMIAVIVHDEVPVQGLTRSQVEAIFTSDISDWSQVGGRELPMRVYTRNTSSGTYKSFQNLAMKGREYGKTTQKLAGGEQIDREVAMTPGGIGYVGLAYTKREGIRSLPIDGVAPSEETQHTYPLARYLYLLTAGEPEGEVARFLEWTSTPDPEAAKVIRKVGFLAPVKRPPSD